LDRLEDRKIFFKSNSNDFVFYSLELQMAGAILLTAMAAGGVSLWLKRRRVQKELDEAQSDATQNH
jgi:hypothetical protein